jgi:hypothetical protein
MTLQERLGLENQILQRDGLSQFQVYRSWYGDSFYISGTHKTNSGNAYKIFSPIPCRYPNSRPPVYIQEPNPLRGYEFGKTINSYGTNHSMHTLSNGPNGEVQICHWRDERWHSGITLNKVMLKVVLWLEAYEQHLLSGDPISAFVGTMY